MPKWCSKARSYSEPLWGATSEFLSPLFLDFEASWLPRCPQVGGQDGAQIDKKPMPKNDEFLKASWKLKISKHLRFWRPAWRLVGTKIEAEIDVIFERRLFEKTLFFRRKNLLFEIQWVEVGSKNRCKKRCGKRKARKLTFNRF